MCRPKRRGVAVRVKLKLDREAAVVAVSCAAGKEFTIFAAFGLVCTAVSYLEAPTE